MAHKNVHTTYNVKAKNWRNISEDAVRPSKTFETKQQAQVAGREIAINRHAEHLIHNKDGKIGVRNSYGNDPIESRG